MATAHALSTSPALVAAFTTILAPSGRPRRVSKLTTMSFTSDTGSSAAGAAPAPAPHRQRHPPRQQARNRPRRAARVVEFVPVRNSHRSGPLPEPANPGGRSLAVAPSMGWKASEKASIAVCKVGSSVSPASTASHAVVGRRLGELRRCGRGPVAGGERRRAVVAAVGTARREHNRTNRHDRADRRASHVAKGSAATRVHASQAGQPRGRG